MRTGNGQFRKFRFGHILRYCLMFISSSFWLYRSRMVPTFRISYFIYSELHMDNLFLKELKV